MAQPALQLGAANMLPASPVRTVYDAAMVLFGVDTQHLSVEQLLSAGGIWNGRPLHLQMPAVAYPIVVQLALFGRTEQVIPTRSPIAQYSKHPDLWYAFQISANGVLLGAVVVFGCDVNRHTWTVQLRNSYEHDNTLAWAEVQWGHEVWGWLSETLATRAAIIPLVVESRAVVPDDLWLVREEKGL